jgi:hypothetical protein
MTRTSFKRNVQFSKIYLQCFELSKAWKEKNSKIAECPKEHTKELIPLPFFNFQTRSRNIGV